METHIIKIIKHMINPQVLIKKTFCQLSSARSKVHIIKGAFTARMILSVIMIMNLKSVAAGAIACPAAEFPKLLGGSNGDTMIAALDYYGYTGGTSIIVVGGTKDQSISSIIAPYVPIVALYGSKSDYIMTP